MAGRCRMLLAVAALLVAVDARAVVISRIVIVGSSVDIGLAELVAGRTGDLSDADIRAIGVEVTRRYHEAGYVTCHVARLVARRDGALEVHVVESRVREAAVAGVDGPAARELAALMLPEPGEIYNRIVVAERARFASAALGLSSVRVSAENHGDGADVLLRITALVAPRGAVGFGMGYGPRYGYAPVIEYARPAGGGAVRSRAEIGFRDGYLRQGIAAVEFDGRDRETDGGGLLLGARYRHARDVWESMDREFLSNAGEAFAGYGWRFGSATLDCTFRQAMSGLERYRGNWYVDNDSRAQAVYRIADRRLLLDRRRASELAFSASGGASDLCPKGYAMAAASGRTALVPVPWLFVVPHFDAWYATSAERYHWRYVFDETLPGRSDDFTASRWKHTAGIDLLFEAYPDLAMAGPFAVAGWYRNEDDEWRTAVVCGVRCTVQFRGVSIAAAWSWDVSGPLSRGSVTFSAAGSL